MRYFITAGLILVIDRLSKFLVMVKMAEGESIPVLAPILYITYVRNKGAAFGFFQGRVIFLSAVAVLCLLFIFTQWKKIMSKGAMVRWGVIISLVGAIGNLIDRLRWGAVIDFIDVRFFPPIFNVADAAIVMGVALLIWEVVIRDSGPR